MTPATARDGRCLLRCPVPAGPPSGRASGRAATARAAALGALEAGVLASRSPTAWIRATSRPTSSGSPRAFSRPPMSEPTVAEQRRRPPRSKRPPATCPVSARRAKHNDRAAAGWPPAGRTPRATRPPDRDQDRRWSRAIDAQATLGLRPRPRSGIAAAGGKRRPEPPTIPGVMRRDGDVWRGRLPGPPVTTRGIDLDERRPVLLERRRRGFRDTESARPSAPTSPSTWATCGPIPEPPVARGSARGPIADRPPKPPAWRRPRPQPRRGSRPPTSAAAGTRGATARPTSRNRRTGHPRRPIRAPGSPIEDFGHDDGLPLVLRAQEQPHELAAGGSAAAGDARHPVALGLDRPSHACPTPRGARFLPGGRPSAASVPERGPLPGQAHGAGDRAFSSVLRWMLPTEADAVPA